MKNYLALIVLLSECTIFSSFHGMDDAQSLVLGAAGIVESPNNEGLVYGMFEGMEGDDADQVMSALEELGSQVSDMVRYRILGVLSPTTESVLEGNELDVVLSWFNQAILENEVE